MTANQEDEFDAAVEEAAQSIRLAEAEGNFAEAERLRNQLRVTAQHLEVNVKEVHELADAAEFSQEEQGDIYPPPGPDKIEEIREMADRKRRHAELIQQTLLRLAWEANKWGRVLH